MVGELQPELPREMDEKYPPGNMHVLHFVVRSKGNPCVFFQGNLGWRYSLNLRYKYDYPTTGKGPPSFDMTYS